MSQPEIQVDINRLMANFSVRTADLTTKLVIAETKIESCMAMIAERDGRIAVLEGLLAEREAAEQSAAELAEEYVDKGEPVKHPKLKGSPDEVPPLA